MTTGIDRRTKCRTCGAHLRTEGVPPHPGYLIADTVTLTAHVHGSMSESRRYCVNCARVVQDALREMGFTFVKVEVCHYKDDGEVWHTPDCSCLKRSQERLCACPNSNVLTGRTYHQHGCPNRIQSADL